jgi:hypothetical protein
MVIDLTQSSPGPRMQLGYAVSVMFGLPFPSPHLEKTYDQ